MHSIDWVEKKKKKNHLGEGCVFSHRMQCGAHVRAQTKEGKKKHFLFLRFSLLGDIHFQYTSSRWCV